MPNEVTPEKALGVNKPVSWMAGAILGPGLLSSFAGGNPVVSLGVPAAAAFMGSGPVKGLGQGALAVQAASLVAPAVSGVFGGGGSGSGGLDRFATA